MTLFAKPSPGVTHPSAACGRCSEGASECRGLQMPRSFVDEGRCRAPQTEKGDRVSGG